jgi:transposase
MRGRKPQYHPTFLPEEVAQARELLRQSNAPYAQVRRAKLLVLLVEEPKISNVEAARRVDAHVQFVHKWREIWTTGEFRLEDLPRPGRPRAFSPSGRGHGQEDCLRVARPA